MIIFLSLLVSVYPRFPRAGQEAFPNLAQSRIRRISTSSPTRRPRLKELPKLCASLSRILWWKNITLLTANLLSIASLAAGLILLFVGWL